MTKYLVITGWLFAAVGTMNGLYMETPNRPGWHYAAALVVWPAVMANEQFAYKRTLKSVER